MTPDRREFEHALSAGRARWACHLTYAAALPDIAASGGLLAPALRGAPATHSWGANTALGESLVCLSLAVSWGMVRHHLNGHEVAILTVDLHRLPDLEPIRISPANSGSHEATPYLAEDADAISALKECNDRDVRWKAEVLVPGGVPLSVVYGVVFCDAEARDAWWPEFVKAMPDHMAVPDVRLADAGRWFRLPDDFAVRDRVRPVRSGVDRLVGEPPAGWKRRLPPIDIEIEPELEEPHWMDDDDWGEPEEDEGPASWADFYDDGEPDDPDWYGLNIRD